MNRPIKFRAWDELRKMIVPACYIDLVNSEVTLYDDNICAGHQYSRDLCNLKIMQFTGLLDCEGNEIYEGDIVRIHHYEGYGLSTINFIEGRWCCTDAEPLYEYNSASLKIIGNIFENPELMENKE